MGCGRGGLWFCAGIVILFLIVPIMIIIPISFTAGQYLEFPPKAYSIRWYKEFMNSPGWLDALWLSARVSAMSTILSTATGVLASVALTRTQFRGKLVVYTFLLLPMIVPTIITAVSVYFLFVRLHLVGSAIGMAIGTSVTAVPIVVIITASTLQAFDGTLEDNAMSLGASPQRAFVRITLPLIAPGVISAALFAFLHSFSELLVPLFLSGPTTMTLSVKIWTSVVMQIEPTIAAVSVILIGLAVLVMAGAYVAQRLFVQPRSS